MNDSFLDDLDGLGESGSENEEENEEEVDEEQQHAKRQRLSDQLADLDDSDDDDGDGGGGEDAMDTQGDAKAVPSPELQALMSKIKSGMSVANIINLRKSSKYKNHMTEVDLAESRKSEESSVSGRLEDDHDYQMILASNKIVADINEEFDAIHRFIAGKYSKKFPELEGLIPNKLDFVQTVKRIGNEMDMTLIDLNDLLPSASVMVVSVTGSTTSGQPLAEADLEECLTGCEEILELEKGKSRILNFIESRMSKIAPNVSLIIGSRIAAQLIGITNGLVSLSKIPSCNLQVIGQEKKFLSGFSKQAAMPHTGIIYYCDLVQNVPPFLRKKLLKIVAAKVTLAARVDSYKIFPNGEEGRKLRQEIEDKSVRLQEPDKAKTKKALPIPEEKKRSKRGGKKVRRFKERFAMTDIRKAQNKLSTTNEDEYGDSAMGIDIGMVGKEDSGRIRAPVEKKAKLNLHQNKKKAINAGSSGVTNGLSSTLVFSTVQGMELASMPSAADRVKEANSKWFSANSGFMSAAPSALPNKNNMVLK